MILLYFGKLLWMVSFAFSAASARSSNSKQRDYGKEIKHLHVDKVWKDGITGRGVVVAVVDDGLNYYHGDLWKNYNSQASADFVDNDRDPRQILNGHGTKCAAIIAGKFNGSCRTGIAYNAKIGGIRIFNGTIPTDQQEANAFGFNKNVIDIYSNSWGPSDSGYTIRGPTKLAKNALKNGVSKGRKSLGSIFVFSGGNGGVFEDSCAFDGYVNSIYTIAIGALTIDGRIPRYAESCGSIIASTFGDDVRTCSGYGQRCVNDFGRTSAATAMASGIIALALEANKKLTWRDVQHLIVRTSNPKGVRTVANEWTTNGARLMVHPSAGFGIINAKHLVDTARKWKPVPSQISCPIVWRGRKINAIPYDGSDLKIDMQSTLNKACSRIKYIEHVEVKLSLGFLPRAFMLMFLKSPDGTKTQFLYQRKFDAITRRRYYKNLVVSSLHYWGENPSGNWEVSFKTSRVWFRNKGKLTKLRITFHGTATDPLAKNRRILPSGTEK